MKAVTDTKTRKLVFFDLETGGLNPSRHPIIQLAALAVDERLTPLEAIELKVRFDESKATRASLRKNHYNRGVWAREAIEPREAARLFADFLSRHASATVVSGSGRSRLVAQLAAHNAAFDGPFLQAWYERVGVFMPARYQVLCTLQRRSGILRNAPACPPKNFKLATLCEYCGIPFHAADAHDALGDVTATFMLYRAIAGCDRADEGDELTTEGFQDSPSG